MTRGIINLFIIVCTLFLSSDVQSQISDTIIVGTRNDFAGTYLSILPENGEPSALLVLMPGLGQPPEDVLLQSDLPIAAKKNGYITIIPTLQSGYISFGIDSVSQNSLHRIITDAINRYELDEVKFYIGGFSLGGSTAVKFAEIANRENFEATPDAVFAIDAPLDFERFYKSRVRENRLNSDEEPSQENKFMIQKIEQVMGGSPEEAIENYHYVSPYSINDISQHAIKYLIYTPVRLYAEPDIDWWITQRGGDFSGMNVLDSSSMINELRRLGNDDAFLVTTTDKGYRKPNNIRHPHSWSILDSEDLINWLEKL